MNLNRIKPVLITMVVIAAGICSANYLDSYTFAPNKIDSIQNISKNLNAKVTALMVGDSVALTLGYDLTLDQKSYDLNIVDKAQLGCGLAIGGLVQTNNEVTPASGLCSASSKTQWPQKYSQWIRKYKPNVVVLLAGRWETANRTYRGKWTNITQPTFKNYIKNQLQLAFNILTRDGASLLLETEPCSNSGLDRAGNAWPQDSIERVNVYNSLLYQMQKNYPNQVYVQDLNSMVCPKEHYESSIDKIRIRKLDGVHFSTSDAYAVAGVLGPKLLPYWEFVGHTGIVRQQLFVTTS